MAKSRVGSRAELLVGVCLTRLSQRAARACGARTALGRARRGPKAHRSGADKPQDGAPVVRAVPDQHQGAAAIRSDAQAGYGIASRDVELAGRFLPRPARRADFGHRRVFFSGAGSCPASKRACRGRLAHRRRSPCPGWRAWRAGRSQELLAIKPAYRCLRALTPTVRNLTPS